MDYTLIHYDVNAWEVRGRLNKSRAQCLHRNSHMCPLFVTPTPLRYSSVSVRSAVAPWHAPGTARAIVNAIFAPRSSTCLVFFASVLAQGRAYQYGLETLRAAGVPVDGLRFDPDLVIRGLIMDKEYGNLIKVDRFG